jgi:hypothetical protein
MARKGGKKNKKSKKVVDDFDEVETSNDAVDDDEQDNEPEEESWDVLPGIDRNALDRLECRTDGCAHSAAAVWISNQNPEDHWPLCEPCTKRDFGPDTIIPEPPVSSSSSLSNKVEEIETEEETAADAPTDEADAQAATEQADEEEQDEQDRDDREDEDEDESDEDPELWTLTKVLSIQAIQHEAPIKCQTADCTLLAATAWVSNRNPQYKWYTCLDCQVRTETRRVILWMPFASILTIFELSIVNTTRNKISMVGPICVKYPSKPLHENTRIYSLPNVRPRLALPCLICLSPKPSTVKPTRNKTKPCKLT